MADCAPAFATLLVLAVILVVCCADWGAFAPGAALRKNRAPFGASGAPQGQGRPKAYAEIRPFLRTFDVVAFRGNGPLSGLIGRAVRLAAVGGASDGYTHVGTIIRGEDFPYGSPFRRPRAVYLFESTLGGWLGDQVPSIDGPSYAGAQLRALDAVVGAYESRRGTSLDWLPLRDDLRPTLSAEAWQRSWRRHGHARIGAMGAGLHRLARAGLFRPALLRSEYRAFVWQSCAELAANVLADHGILPLGVQPGRATPADWSQKGGRLGGLYWPAVPFTSRLKPTRST